MRAYSLIPAFVLLTSQVLADCGPGPAQNSFIACAASLDSNTITGCIQDSPQQTSTPSGYNYAACSCTSLSIYSSCMEAYCPAQATQDILPAKDYYCALATGGSPTWGVPAVQTDVGAAATGGTGGANGGAGGGAGAAQTGTSAAGEAANGAQSTGKPSGAGTVEPVLGLGAGMLAVLGVVVGWL